VTDPVHESYDAMNQGSPESCLQQSCNEVALLLGAVRRKLILAEASSTSGRVNRMDAVVLLAVERPFCESSGVPHADR
jgi:hypothetical protein